MSGCKKCGEDNCHKFPKCPPKCRCEVEIPSFSCVRTDKEYECIGIKKGDTLEKTISALHEKVCNFIPGLPGPAGIGIQSTSYNTETGQLTLIYTNGSTFTTGDLRGEEGNGIESTSYNAGTGELTLNFTDGTSFTTGDLRGPIGPPGPNELIIQNTLIVTKNGNDLTGERNDWAKPFLTVAAASVAAQSGDLVIVFPGTYNENNFLKTDVNYEFKLGATMVSTNDCINDASGPMNINILGEGVFISTNSRGMLLVDPLTNIYMRLKDMIGFLDGIAIGNANNVDIEGRYITAYEQYTATIRGNCIGKIHFDSWDGMNSSLTASTVFFVNHSIDLESREFEISGDIISNSTAFGALAIDNSPTLKVKANSDITHTSGVVDDNIGAINVRSGSLKYTGKAISIDNNGLVLSDIGDTNVIVYTKNSEIQSSRSAVRYLSAGSNYLRADETIFRSSGSGVSTILIDAVVNNNQVILRNSDIYNTGTGTGADGIYCEDQISEVRLSDVKVVVASEVAFLMDSGVVRTVDIESVVFSNKALSANVTNGITGSLLVVDANIEDNTLNF